MAILSIVAFSRRQRTTGYVATGRLIGRAQVEPEEKGGPWKRVDQFLAVVPPAHSRQRLEHLDDLRPYLLPEIESFFTHYAGLNGKELRVVGRSGPRRARNLLKGGAKAFKGGT